ncbi:DUF3231 family protein [Desulfallas sp. Bu1-1]|uniref:DUF3231 family protein n=1 Tax=Desulfallas sp. Bu1-1 TaxID=2787620 RepID=UPI00189F6E91|nr:DUF3231 family protein [Desulfallas sp. Bu1-1]MBF7083176.1 DUF3231 family protein [Desulfallas sp. Bu1-1]
MEILQILEKVIDIGKTPQRLQKEINVLEVSNLWIQLTYRYDVAEETQILLNFVEDGDLKVVMELGMKRLNKQIDILEKWIKDYAISAPDRHRAVVNTVIKPEVISDKYIFIRIFSGIQAFLSIHLNAFIQTPSPKLRELFREFLLEEINIYDKVFEYGKLKNWISEPPSFRV